MKAEPEPSIFSSPRCATNAHDGQPRSRNHRLSWRASPRTWYLCQPRGEAHGRPSSAPRNPEGVDGGGQRRVTPRQACPRPNGFGRNLRSKTRWFTGFCNSHQVSHFATFFIDARAEISVAESRFDIFEDDDAARAHRFRGDGDALSRSISLAQFAPVFVCTPGRVGRASATQPPRDKGDEEPHDSSGPRFETSSRVVLLGRFRQ